MEVALPNDLRTEIEQEISTGHFRNADELFEQALRQFLDDQRHADRRLEALQNIGDAVDRAGLYERVFVPGKQAKGDSLFCPLLNLRFFWTWK